MSSTKKLIELDNEAIQILEKQAKLQKRSLKNYIEYTLEEKAQYFKEPSEEYKKEMDRMLQLLDAGKLETIPMEDIKRKYGL